MADQTDLTSIAVHGGTRLPAVDIDSYNSELKDQEGFVGDRASKGAFRDLIEHWRKALRKTGEDPLGEESSDEISKKQLDALLVEGDPEAAGVIQSAIEGFAQELAGVLRRFLALKAWRDTEEIVVGGGLMASREGALAIGRAAVILKADKVAIDLAPIHNDPDEAGLIGAVQLAPRWVFEGHDAILAADIGGSNIRAGVVTLNLKKASDLSKAAVWKSELWRHAAEKRVTRQSALDRLVAMLTELIERAEKEKLRMAPFIGIGCPGTIAADGTIERGAQNLPGNWEGKNFNLPASLKQAIPRIGEHDTAIMLHNDAVVQGLSEVPYMSKVDRWGVLTIGTGLGNARFSNRSASKD
jgi:predicted NBD/HSP70 family sugar kinase